MERIAVAEHHERRRQGMGMVAGAESRGAGEPYDALADLFLGGPESPGTPELDPPTLKFPGVAPIHHEGPGVDDGAEEEEPARARVETDSEPIRPRARAPRCRPGEVELVVTAHLPVMASAWVNQWARCTAAEAGCVAGLVRERGEETTVELVGPIESLPELEPVESIGEALEMAREVAGRWLVQAEGAEWSPGLSYATVLTGADDAAVVGCYRTLKQFRAPEGLAIRVAVMGADGKRAAEVERKIARAAAEFLEREVAFAGPVSRIGATPGAAPMGSRLLFRGRSEHAVESLVRAVVESSRNAGKGPDPARVAERHAEPPKAEPHPTVEARGNGIARPMLAPLVYGLRPIRVRCPVAAGVELAVDDEGRLHLLSGEASAAESLKALTAASAWAKLNAELVRAADPSITRLDAATEPVLHLVTEEPRQASRLLDSPVKVHVLVPPSPAPVARALN